RNTTGNRNAFFGIDAGSANVSGSNNSALGHRANVSSGGLSFATAVGAGATVTANNTIQLGRIGLDTVRIGRLGTPGSTNICRNSLNELSVCSSSIRYKSNIKELGFGLDVIEKLQPVSFKWLEDGQADIGLVAEDVFKISPLLITLDKNGNVEGVKYDRLGVVLLNAVKEQQKLIESQNAKINELKQLVCKHMSDTRICK
ncbi:MAG: hypothetical protein HKN25_01615, partial [Pyrinomonadaceae bacterium]|nr:hypothetical protein [Pyrinomonadaceae bacterium]